MKESIQLRGRNYDSAEVLVERYGVTYATISNWQKAGKLPKPVRLGGRTFYDRDMVENHILGQCQD